MTCPNKCGTTFYYPIEELKQLIKDMKYHSNVLCSLLPQNKTDELLYMIHRPYQSLRYFTYVLLKENGIISKYTTWQEWEYKLFLDIDWNKDHWIYLAWLDAMKDTCMNIPCNECQLKDYYRTQAHNDLKKKPHIHTQYGQIRPIPIIEKKEKELFNE